MNQPAATNDPNSSHDDPISYAARWLVPVDAPPIENGCLVVRGETIAAVGPRRIAEGRVVDLGDVIVMPGFVNAHVHLEFSDLQCPLGSAGAPFPDWLRAVIAHRRRIDFQAGAAVEHGLAESRLAGVTTLGEISSADPWQWFTPARLEAETRVVAFVELIGLSEPRASTQIERLEEFLRRNDGPSLRRGISPHATYTVRPSLFEAAVSASAKRRVPLAFHLAESREELQLLAAGCGPLVDYLRELGAWQDDAIPRGLRPLDYLKSLTGAHRALVVHGNYLADDEIEFLAARADRMTTVYCPRTHAYFAHEPHPLPKLLAAGAAVAVGTDGRCTNPDLNLLEELRFIAAAYPQLSPERILQLGTLDGARALGLAHEVGSLTPGKRADFITIRSGASLRDPAAAVLSPRSNVVARPTARVASQRSRE